MGFVDLGGQACPRRPGAAREGPGEGGRRKLSSEARRKLVGSSSKFVGSSLKGDKDYIKILVGSCRRKPSEV